MSILRRLLGTEQRNVTGGQWLSDKPAESSAGVQLNQQNATSIGALYAAVKLYADTVASLPVGAFIRDGGVRRPVTRPRFWRIRFRRTQTTQGSRCVTPL